MTETYQSLHDKKIEDAATELRSSGYKVTVEPSSADMPFDLGNYKPDIIATKNGEGIVLEVKAVHARLSVDRFQEIAEQVAKHSGWKFILVTLDDVDERIVPSAKGELPAWDELNYNLGKIDDFFRDSLLEPGLLYLWSTIEAMLRKRSFSEQIPIHRFPPAKLLNHMYSSGEISIAEYDLLKALFEKRNKAAHGLVVALEKDELEKAAKIARELLAKWREGSSQI
jgi:hypothetical protein